MGWTDRVVIRGTLARVTTNIYYPRNHPLNNPVSFSEISNIGARRKEAIHASGIHNLFFIILNYIKLMQNNKNN